MTALRAGAQDVKIPFTKTQAPNGMVVILSEDHAVPQVVVNVDLRRRLAHGGAGPHRVRAPVRAPDVHGDAARAHQGVRRLDGGGGRAQQRLDRRGPHRLLRHRSVDRAAAPPLARGRSHARSRAAHRPGASSTCSATSSATSGGRASRTGPTASRSSTLPTLLWPEAHPYHHPVIGSHEDLEAASVADVKEFFATWYDPANASLVVAGDFDPQQAKAPHRQELRRASPARASPPTPARPASATRRRR